MAFRRGHVADILSKMKTVKLVASKKEVKVFVTNDKIQSSEQKLKFYKTCIYLLELDSFSVLKSFSDKIGRGINE